MSEETELTFEQAYEQLCAIVERFESGELPLEESVTLYEQGQKLARLCGEMLDSAELRVRQLDEDGVIDDLQA